FVMLAERVRAGEVSLLTMPLQEQVAAVEELRAFDIGDYHFVRAIQRHVQVLANEKGVRVVKKAPGGKQKSGYKSHIGFVTLVERVRFGNINLLQMSVLDVVAAVEELQCFDPANGNFIRALQRQLADLRKELGVGQQPQVRTKRARPLVVDDAADDTDEEEGDEDNDENQKPPAVTAPTCNIQKALEDPSFDVSEMTDDEFNAMNDRVRDMQQNNAQMQQNHAQCTAITDAFLCVGVERAKARSAKKKKRRTMASPAPAPAPAPTPAPSQNTSAPMFAAAMADGRGFSMGQSKKPTPKATEETFEHIWNSMDVDFGTPRSPTATSRNPWASSSGQWAGNAHH
ncbi:MAG: hypothetical protein SGILL_010606, partial [Bacillariaceae sp.]